MDTIIISDLEVAYHVGVSDAERLDPQKLLLSLEITRDFDWAAESDALEDTADYFAICQRLLQFGEGRSWKLLEKLAVELAMLVRNEFRCSGVTVEIKKFVIPQARHVGVRVSR